MGKLQWLEIDGDDVVGVHSTEGHSDFKWVQLSEEDEEPNPGDKFIDGKIVRVEIEMDVLQEKRMVAQHKITGQYPVWKQVNILRAGTKSEQTKMGTFVDAVRNWSNDPKSTLKQLEKIKP